MSASKVLCFTEDLKAHREFILDQKRKETTTKTELIEEMADLQKEITELKQKEGFSDQDPEYRQKMSEYKHLEASLEEKNNALATLEVEDQNNQTDTNLLLSITAKKPECMLGLDRHGAVYWHIPLDTNPDQPVFGIIVNDPMDKSKWFTFSNIHMLVSFLGTLLPNGIRESSLKNALLKLHEPYNVVLSKQIDPLVSAGASKINTAYEQFNQFMLTEEITVQDLSTFESDCLPPVVEAMEKLAIALDKSIEGLEQCKSVEDFKSKIEISWLNATDLLDESDLEYLQETKSLSALYNWALDTEDHVQNELLHQAKKEKEIQRKQEREKQMRQQELEQQKLQQSRKRNTRSKTESRPNSASRQSRTITTRSGRELRRDRSSSDVGASESEMVTRSGQRKRSSVSDSYSTRKQRKMESSSEAESTESEKEPPKTRGRKQASREASPEPKPRNTRQRKKASVESSPEPTVTKKRSSIVVVDSSPEPKPSATKKRSSIVVVDESSEPEQKAVPPKAWSGEMMKKKVPKFKSRSHVISHPQINQTLMMN
ncbi:hypothetical protein EDD86DRAFT_123935 [Gorgonomyces haynaldii]|nr:hypothetical protein EDD86DRAFT_123935 [Gorgonomyces haynaldii]